MHVTRRPKIEPKPEPADSPEAVMDTRDGQDAEVDEDKVVAEVFHVLRGPSGSSLDRYAFEQEQPARMEDCGGRLKRLVKHAEFTYKSKQRADGVPINEKAAMYDGVYDGECSTKYSELLREAVGFFKDDRLYLLPIDDVYALRRQLSRPAENDLTEQNKVADGSLESRPQPNSQVVHVNFTRPETDWQRRRREQSAHHRAQLFEQDAWVECEVEKRDIDFVFSDQLGRLKTSAAPPIYELSSSKKATNDFS